MPLYAKALILLAVQIAPLLLGWKLRAVGIATEAWAKPLSRFIILVVNTGICFLGAWNLEIRTAGGLDPDLLVLLGIATLFGLGITGSGLLLSRLHVHDNPSRGGYLVASCISNFGFSMAGFVCLLLFGDQGVSLQVFTIYPLLLFIYLVWFSLGRYYGTEGGGFSIGATFLRAFTDALSIPLLGTLGGLALNYWGPPIPEVIRWILIGSVYVGAGLSTFCIGITLIVRSVGDYPYENVTVAVTKFVIGPLIGYGLATWFGLDDMKRHVVLIITSVPVGLYSSFAASLFGLNRNLSNSLFLVNSGLYLFVILPILALLIEFKIV